MSIDSQKQEVIAAIEQMKDESALRQIMHVLQQGVAPKQRAPLGFARGNSGIRMAGDFDAPLDDFADYM